MHGASQAQLPGFGAMLGRAWVTTLHIIAMIAIVREIATTLALFPVGIAVVPVLQLVVARLDRLNAFREGLKGGPNGACLSVPAFGQRFYVELCSQIPFNTHSLKVCRASLPRRSRSAELRRRLIERA